MEMDGTRVIAADRATVWEKLNDAETLKACIPGCSDLTGNPDDGFEAVVTQKVGPVKATFKGAVQLSNVVPGQSYTISGEGKGGVAGFANGGADVSLADVEGGTELTYAVKAKVGGKLAQLGNRIISGFARKMADQFFDRFQAEVEGGGSDQAEDTATA
ncbi:carbon monoxide dehydrogenase subunit G [Ponticoccus sp. SC2-23]|uniref:CoxG family protein n=1 Tax=Alexandriicola marinus TaxID=2081710 RepID=UPI000FDCC5B6|nr:carbon monoxide dehydrogenase subunit G [Alexandriicola marinus]MBM1219686.1 carbon monoxide dehydrogenase subunit G [Ponticoccus sp. SC6-9]MBM1223242.1 carbon monoxide dehydrogenase subunit G [Ponticoccus sp. SC6-15]MBM1229499.1 carbon monoxide dehydrogenase subunit G [Ponticoccus sp. SC6-38]MBM1232208.1 carbon monoxide dehydrogenase subunit G [Ponticoccus sp. SC6-45]MBM1237842.1 carbon monoxide dehydrogenase subunit G [Ponticoccus sp. SC6-49]MBM1241219.1 carbon monoxide dehydrogenase sub